jgi:RNA polymerase sigma-70 factor (ECF subfamily)
MAEVARWRAMEGSGPAPSRSREAADDRPADPGEATPTPSDRELAASVRRGNHDAFGQLYDRHVAAVFAYIELRVRDPSLAEDLTQDVFTCAWAAMPRFVWRGDLRPWLLCLARNRVANHWRSVRRHPEPEQLRADELQHDAPPNGGASFGPGVEIGPEALDRALGRLTDGQREVLALRFGAGLSVRETARQLGLSETAVRSLQYRAVRRLAQQLGEREQA